MNTNGARLDRPTRQRRLSTAQNATALISGVDGNDWGVAKGQTPI